MNFGDFPFAFDNYGEAAQDQMIGEGDGMPSSCASLEDYLVFKPSGRKGKPWKPTEIDSLSSDTALETPVSTSTDTGVSIIAALETPTPCDTSTGALKFTSPSDSLLVCNSSPVFDYPSDVYGDDGAFRFCSVSDGGMVVMQWSLAGMMWRNLGKIASNKTQAFVGAMESLKTANTDHDGNMNNLRYIRAAEDLINQIREGVASPVLRRQPNMDLMQSRQRLSPTDSFKMSNAMAQAAMQTTEQRRQLAQERGQLRKPSGDSAFGMQPGFPGDAGLSHNNTELARRTGTLHNLGGRIERETSYRQLLERQLSDHSKRTSEPRSQEGRRTVLHDPYQSTRPRVDSMFTEPDAIWSKPQVSDQDDHSGKGDSRGALSELQSAATSPIQPAPVDVHRARAGQAVLSKLTDDELRASHPLVPHCDPNGPFFTDASPDDEHEVSHDQSLDDFWWSYAEFGPMRKHSKADEIVAKIGGDIQNEGAIRLLVPLYEQLWEYAQSRKQGYEGPTDYFANFVHPPDRMMKTNRLGSIGDRTPPKNFFQQGDERGRASQPTGKGTPLASPELRPLTPGVAMPTRRKVLVARPRVQDGGVIGAHRYTRGW